MTVSTFLQTDRTAQTVTAYDAAIDADFSVLTRLGDAFAPHALPSPNMTVALDPGHIFDGSALTEVAAQSSATITAPVTNPRIDRIVIDQFTGVQSVVTGIESASPIPPAIPSGKNPIAQVLLQTSSSAITNAMITDERDFSFLGGGISGVSAGTGLTGGGSAGVVTLALSVPVAVANGGTGATAAGATAASNIGALAQANNLSDLASVGTARNNLGLGTIATQNANAVAITGGAVTGLSAPINPTDAATKAYVDAVASGLSVRVSVAVATTTVLPFTPAYNNGSSGVGATLTASSNGALTIDGYGTQINDRVLVKDQASALQNGIYVVTASGSVSSAYILTRATDANSATNILPGLFTFVVRGTTNQGGGFVLTTPAPITVGTTGLTFTQFSGAGEITAGTGLTKSGNTLALSVPVAVANGGTGATAAGATAANNIGALPKAGGTMTGKLILAAGTTSVAPLGFQSGTNLTTPSFGAVEFDGTSVFVTNNSGAPTRKTIAYIDSNITGNAASATKLQTARAINGVAFDGTANISFTTDSVAEGSTNLYFTNARASAAAPVQSFDGRTGAVVLNSADVVSALGYTPATSSSTQLDPIAAALIFGG